jgi:uncharacterized protein (DUF305 family)
MLGGLIVSLVATSQNDSKMGAVQDGEMSMSGMTESLKGKTGDDYDKTFVEYMIEHHQAAVDMARLSSANAKHQEVKDLSDAIISAQEKEIGEMKRWQRDWGYGAMSDNHNMPQ